MAPEGRDRPSAEASGPRAQADLTISGGSRQNREMAEPASVFDQLLPRLDELGERVAALPEGQTVALSRDEAIVLVEVVLRMARGFQVLERRGFR